MVGGRQLAVRGIVSAAILSVVRIMSKYIDIILMIAASFEGYVMFPLLLFPLQPPQLTSY